jgi:hypothetical protein
MKQTQIPQSDLSHGGPKSTEQIFYEADRADRTFIGGVKRVFAPVAGLPLGSLCLCGLTALFRMDGVEMNYRGRPPGAGGGFR